MPDHTKHQCCGGTLGKPHLLECAWAARQRREKEMMQDHGEQARELLAAEYERAGNSEGAARIREAPEGHPSLTQCETGAALRALTKALSQRPSPHDEGANAGCHRKVLEALYQYESDLLHPPVGDSVERRLARVRKVIAEAEATRAARQKPVPYVHPAPGKVSPCLSFDGGSLTIYQQGYNERDGDGYFAFRDDELDWEDDEDGGAAYRIAKVHNSEVLFLRDHLNQLFPPARAPKLDEGVIAERDLNEERMDCYQFGTVSQPKADHEGLVERLRAPVARSLCRRFDQQEREDGRSGGALTAYNAGVDMTITFWDEMADAAFAAINLPALLDQARADALEEAAKECDASIVKTSQRFKGWNDCCRVLATKFRSLSATRKGSGG